MSQYSDFSSVYDLFMDNVPYKEWADGIVKTLKEYGIEDGIVLDLGCGTGTITSMLAKMGYDMIGIDSSEDMLAEAMEKNFCEISENSDSDEASDLNEKQILYLCQDITEFELYGTVRAVISTCDTLNYLTDTKDFLKTLRLVNNYLEPDGVFIFDMNAKEKYETVLADNVFAENRDDASFIWENTYDGESGINEYALTLFTQDEETGLYERTEEFHYQRAYSIDEIKGLLDEAGFEIVDEREEDMRLYFTAKVINGRKIGNVL